MLTVTGAPKLPTVIDVEPAPPAPAPPVILMVVEAEGAVETLFKILLTSASAASFSAWAPDNFALASDKNLFSVSSLRLAACNSF